ncbi:MAG: histidine kinase [Alsobacter sp.]
MAEYYPLISRAVTNMGPSTPEQRKALYERATNALLGQLRASDPPVPEADIERERLGLEDAIRRVETEAAGSIDRAMFEEVLEQARLATALPPRPAAPLPDEAPAAGDPAGLARGPHPVEPSPARATPLRPLRPAAEESFPEPPVAPVERPRPPAPRMERKDRRWLRGAVIGLAIAAVVGGTAALAIMLKHQPADFSPKPQAEGQAAQQEAKYQDRLPGETTAATAPSAPAAPTAAGGVAGPAPGAPEAPAIGVLQRVLLVEEPAEGSSEPRQTNGRVLWRMDSVSTGANDPLDAAVRAEIDLADAGLKAELLLRRNRDAALPASHTIEIKFTSTERSPNGPVRDVGVPEMRQEETVRGTPLAGISVPVTENLFLTGLSSLPADITRNIELLRSRNWFVVALRFANGRRAVMLVEKGNSGTRAVADALQAWQQG